LHYHRTSALRLRLVVPELVSFSSTSRLRDEHLDALFCAINCSVAKRLASTVVNSPA
jgi:hypothetical protein